MNQGTKQLLRPTRSQATLGLIPPTAEKAAGELGAVVAALRAGPLAVREGRSHQHTHRWKEAALRSCFRPYPTAGSVVIQLRTKL